jgi:hypothetical protein
MAPANGATAARASVLAMASQAYEVAPPISATVYATRVRNFGPRTRTYRPSEKVDGKLSGGEETAKGEDGHEAFPCHFRVLVDVFARSLNVFVRRGSADILMRRIRPLVLDILLVMVIFDGSVAAALRLPFRRLHNGVTAMCGEREKGGEN